MKITKTLEFYANESDDSIIARLEIFGNLSDSQITKIMDILDASFME